jgi:hypothetical protein
MVDSPPRRGTRLYARGGGSDSRHYTGHVGTWYTVGLCLGLGLAFGVLLAGAFASSVVGIGAAVVLGAGAGLVAGLLIEGTPETIAGAVGGALGAFAAAVVVQGALRRGATRLGVAAYLGAAGVLVGLVSFVPIVGYVAAVALPVLALRMRGRQAARYAGLRTLAK